MTSQIIYKSDLRTEAIHIQSGTQIETDAPTDNQGKGERFSPTDLVVVALCTCMVTTMGIKAQSMDLALDGTRVEVTKFMVSDPRRIGKIIANVYFPAGITENPQHRDLLERTARTCPVERSLHPDIDVQMQFVWE